MVTDGLVHSEDNEVFWRKDGSSFPVEYVSTPLRDENGKLIGAVVTFNDISEHKKREEALRDTLGQVERKHILNVLKQTSWQISGDLSAAVILDMHPNTLRLRMQKLGLVKGESR